jgi:predicted AAA+ superfamily ATPase
MEEQNEERTEYVRGFFERIPSELSKHDKRYVLNHVREGARMREYAGPIQWLDQAMIVNLAHNVDDPSAALNLSITDPSFKCYLMDTGLLVSLAYRGQPYLDNELYRAILLDKLHVNEGMVVENATAQSLRASGHRAFFYKEVDKATRRTTMEVDFLVRRGSKVCPVEVKSSASKSTKSLTRFREKFGKRVGTPYVLHAGDVKREGEVVYLPYYMAPLL